MIRKLQRKFVLTCSGTVLLILFLVLGLSAYVNFWNAYRQTDEIMDYLCEQKGDLPSDLSTIDIDDFKYGFTEESFFQVRYFSVILGEDGEVSSSNVDNIASVSQEEA